MEGGLENGELGKGRPPQYNAAAGVGPGPGKCKCRCRCRCGCGCRSRSRCRCRQRLRGANAVPGSPAGVIAAGRWKARCRQSVLSGASSLYCEVPRHPSVHKILIISISILLCGRVRQQPMSSQVPRYPCTYLLTGSIQYTRQCDCDVVIRVQFPVAGIGWFL